VPAPRHRRRGPGHIWPTHHENIHFYGTHSVDVDGELAKLGSDGYRTLRATAAVTALPSLMSPVQDILVALGSDEEAVLYVNGTGCYCHCAHYGGCG
jgi:hypothetical protein